MHSWFKFFSRTLGVIFLAFASVGCGGELATLGAASPTARSTTDLFYFVFWFAVAVFVVTEGMLLYSVFRFRRKKAEDIPAQVHGNNAMELGWTVVPALIVIVLFVFTVRTMNTIADVAPGSITVNVTGHQWWWEFQYVEAGVTTANELHIPVGQTVNLKLATSDVIHSFWVPRLSGKTDLIPGRANQMTLRADQIGMYQGQCAEFCGTNHANMRMRVYGDSQADYAAWVAQMQTPPAPATGAAAQGKAVFENGACIGCHTIEGTKGQGKVGPNLTHVASRTTLAAGVLDNTADNLFKWIKNPQLIKPESDMPNLNLSDVDVNALVAYLMTLK